MGVVGGGGGGGGLLVGIGGVGVGYVLACCDRF